MPNYSKSYTTLIIAGAWAVKSRNEIESSDYPALNKAIANCYLTGIIDAAALSHEASENKSQETLDNIQSKLDGYLSLGDGDE
jgi:hypothetical protein